MLLGKPILDMVGSMLGIIVMLGYNVALERQVMNVPLGFRGAFFFLDTFFLLLLPYSSSAYEPSSSSSSSGVSS